ncbi:MAG TPA: LptF/LptG family permease [Caulobacteraceae bacterium]|jgi:lipopolysaccharide export system permease protein
MGALGRLQVYVLTRTLTGMLGAIMVIASVVMLICFVELSRAYGGRGDVGFGRLVIMMLLQSPAIVLLLLPFIFLFGTMAAFVTLNRRSELIAMRAAGVSAWRFIFPAAGAAFLIGVVDISLLNPLAADLNGRYEDAKSAIDEGVGGKGANSAMWLRQGDEHTQVVIHAQSHDMEGGVVHLHHVSLFLQNVTSGGALQFARRIEAAEARLDPGFWRLSDVREATAGAGSVRSDSLSIPSSLDRSTAMEKFAAKDAVGFWRLPDTIDRAETAGFSSAPYRQRYQELLATPLLFAGMSVLAAAFSLRLMRLGGLAGLAGAGVAMGFAIFFFDRICGALGGAEVIPPIIAGWTPPIIALLAGFTLLAYTEDG